MRNTILSEAFGLYCLEIVQYEYGALFWRIQFMDEDGRYYGSEGNGQPYDNLLEALAVALDRLGELYLEDAKILWSEAETTKAGNGTRTHDILLGNIPIMSTPTNEAVQE